MNNEERIKVLKRARAWAARRYKGLIRGEYGNHHYSHAVELALSECEAEFPELGTYGVEWIDLETDEMGRVVAAYLNTGDSYGLTVVFWRGRFIVASWGAIVESVSR